eukprot:6904561-Ditylum_brightwellii.AAC.1
MQQAVQAVDDALATDVHATRCTVTRSLGISPGTLAFQHDMLVNLPVIADLITIREKRQALIDENLRRQHLKKEIMIML